MNKKILMIVLIFLSQKYFSQINTPKIDTLLWKAKVITVDSIINVIPTSNKDRFFLVLVEIQKKVKERVLLRDMVNFKFVEGQTYKIVAEKLYPTNKTMRSKFFIENDTCLYNLISAKK